MISRFSRGVVLTLLFAFPVGMSAQQPQPISDKDLRVVHYDQLKYPPLAVHTRVEGVVVLSVQLDDGGNVVDASALSGSEFLIPDCLKNIKTWKFQPNSHHSAIVVYNFRLPIRKGCKPLTTIFKVHQPNLAEIIGCPLTVQP